MHHLSYQVNVIQCSKCQRETEYKRPTCGANLCQKCKRIHTIDLDAINHDVLLHRESIYNRKKDTYKTPFLKNETCAKHCDQVIIHCRDHLQHNLINVRKAYERKREQSEKIFSNIRSEVLYNIQCLRAGLKLDVIN